jgi:uncharacterized surface protein with fasciclin (FAS1) repeats
MKTDKKIKHYLYIKRAVLWVIFPLLMSACKKEATDIGASDANTLNNVISDNFNLSVFSTVLKYSGQDRILKDKGPFTILAPSDVAFANIGYATTASVAAAEPAVISRIARYHMLDGRYELSKLPFQFNQELRSRGGKLYVTRWIKGLDTVLTINGARVLAKNIPASNGLVQVINRVLTPYIHEKLGTALAAEQSITLFYQALVSSGLLETINSTGPYTVFAPNNEAMQAFGYATVAEVSDADPEVLKRLVRYHIIRDRRFIYDYILGSDGTLASKQNMLDGNSISINLIEDSSQPGGFSGITVKGQGNMTDVNVVKQDMLTGNGVLHIIDGVLSPAF